MGYLFDRGGPGLHHMGLYIRSIFKDLHIERDTHMSSFIQEVSAEHLAHSQDSRRRAFEADLAHEIECLGELALNAFQDEKERIEKQAFLLKQAQVERDLAHERDVLYHREKLRRSDALQAKRDAERADAILEAPVLELIRAVKRQEVGTVTRLFASDGDLDPMKRLKTHMEEIDYSDMSRPMGPPCQHYGDCALQEGILTQNIPILDVLLTRVPVWVGRPGLDLLKLVDVAITQRKLTSLACILRMKGYPHVTGWSTEYDSSDLAMKHAVWQKQKGAIYMLELERSTPGYFFDNRVHIPGIVKKASAM
jgi:hypothetical protein